MSTTRGIFDNFPTPPAPPRDSPFAIAPENMEATPPPSPFAAVRSDSPFTVVDESAESRLVEPGRPARLPERRKPESPFQGAEVDDGFGFEAQAKAYHSAAFPYPGGPPPMGASPFSIEQPMPGQMPMPGYPGWPGSAQQGFAPAPQGFPAPQGYPAYAPPAFAPVQQAAPAMAVQVPTSFAPVNPPTAPVATPAPSYPTPAPSYPAPAPTPESQSDSFSIRQIELRAIFGVDREMAEDEILKRTRALPGIRNVAKLHAHDMATIESLRHLMTNLNFGGGELKLYSGSIPMEFIREGNVILAIQTDGGFAPGVREILMLVARELGRMNA
jgi:hypothetical protein